MESTNLKCFIPCVLLCLARKDAIFILYLSNIGYINGFKISVIVLRLVVIEHVLIHVVCRLQYRGIQ